LQGLDPKGVLGTVDSIFGEAQKLGQQVQALTESISGVAQALPGLATDYERGINLLRAFGEAPKLPGLNFDRPVLKGVAYTFLNPGGQLANAVRLTSLQTFAGDPAREILSSLRSEVNRLVPANLSFPTRELVDRFVPNIKDFNVSDVFKNLSGMPFGKLFPNIRLPDLAKDGIRVSQKVDAKTRTAQVRLDVDVPFEKGRPVQVFSLAGITLTLFNARLVAKIDILTSLNEPPRTVAEGEISGNWEIKLGGYAVAEIVNTALRFNQTGQVRFNVSPENIRLKQVLQFISDFLQRLTASDSGFSIRILPDGVESSLSLPVPDMQGAAFGIANLHVGFTLALYFRNGQFLFSTGLFAGRKSAPFTITIFILGGAGWLETDLSYYPSTGTFQTRVSIAILASASLAISLGPISGGIFAYFGITVEFTGSSGRPGSLTVGVVIMFIGKVSLLNLISIDLGLILQAEYRTGGGLIGRGTVYAKVKIGWCFTLKVRKSVEYRFGKAGGGAEMLPDIGIVQIPLTDHTLEEAKEGFRDFYEEAAIRYFSMFED
jgi:hypothetical protein